MGPRLLRAFRREGAPLVWTNPSPVREELFGIERLEQHAESLAAAQPVTDTPARVLPLTVRLSQNATALLAAYRASAAELEIGRGVVPAAEWLLDNYHLVEEQIREIREDLPPGYYRQLPKLAEGPFAGYPRVFGLAWAFVAHTDSHFDPETLRRFVVAYQRVQPLTIGELWAVAITLRIVLIENLRRLADQITTGRAARTEANALADRLLKHDSNVDADVERALRTLSEEPLSERFAGQLAKRLRDQDPRTTPALGWLERQLSLQGTSVEIVVQHAQLRQGASNVTVRNVITSMRLISDTDWAEFFESVSLVDERLRAGSAFEAMDFATRNLYRSAIEQLSRGSPLPEIEVADRALDAARAGASHLGGHVDAERFGDPGYHLIAGGRQELERQIGFRPPPQVWLRRLGVRLGIGGYVGTIVAAAVLMLWLTLWAISTDGIGGWWLAALGLTLFLPALEVATGLINRTVTTLFGASVLPGLELAEGVPPALKTLVVIPTLLSNRADLIEQVERLEVHYLGSVGGDLTFALLLDGLDADSEIVEGDAPLLAAGAEAVEHLNRRYGAGPSGDRFLVLHRRRIFNAGEGKWMGWERKRGKLHELNRLLRGANDTSFVALGCRAPTAPLGIRFVITLDADTRLPRDAARRLIGKMAHPLNRPRFDEAERRVIDGYGILQPRVTPSLPIGREGSLYQRVFSSPGGIDPYAAAVSDVYQDLFGEGSYTGKGIYDVDAFERALESRVPENTLLSHDLFEGIFVRAGLASDIELVEEFPARYDVAANRQHRWTRGDWQLLPWIAAAGTARGRVPPIGLGKMADNLRRSMLAPLTLLSLFVCWLMPRPGAITGTAFVLASIAVPAFLPALFAVVPRRTSTTVRSHLGALAGDLRLAIWQTALTLTFLPDQAWRMGDAVVRTVNRLVTRRNLLEWTTAAQSKISSRPDLAGTYWQMAAGTLLGLAVSLLAIVAAPQSWPVVLPIALLWLAAPMVAHWISQAPSVARQLAISEADARELRLIGRRTWRFFETFVTPADNMLPPDNFQEDPQPVVAHRTSPTNIGLYLLSTLAARDFGWTGATETIERLEATFAAMEKLQRYKGHFLNWYETRDLRPLDPMYVSSVDSGNLAGHLIALANGCREQAASLHDEMLFRRGFEDSLCLTREALGGTLRVDRRTQIAGVLDEIDIVIRGAQPIQSQLPSLKRLTEKAARAAEAGLLGENGLDADLIFWAGTLAKLVAEFNRDSVATTDGAESIGSRFHAIAKRAEEMALAMDFAFLLDPNRKLLSIGYSLSDNRLDANCYDLLASEARLASLFAIAKGDVPTRHWFRLGRTATPLGHGSALISWSGSMFEYLMPSLVMRAPTGSLLEQTNGLVVKRQIAHGRALGIPWGVSESAYNARDPEFTYQYSNFGVPGLGLKRGLAENAVIAPYATGLAAMVDPQGAIANYTHLAQFGAKGRYGFYEALDFTRSRLPEGADVAVVRSFMAHHQGMTIVAIANALHDGRMRARFHAAPMIQASELLLQERMPRDVAVAHPRAEEVKIAATEPGFDAPTVRRLTAPAGAAPVTHLLSNGRYAVMLTSAGSGYSRWRDIAVTRWREDSTRDDCGSYVFLRDTQTGKVWSAGSQPLGHEPERYEAIFGEDRAEFIRQDGRISTTMDVLVSSEDDGEVRRVSLANNGRAACDIELTSYAELVLAPPAADNAHPAFSKMFIQTEYLQEFGALIATRRRRSPQEPEIWAGHFGVVEGELAAAPAFETDRARFIGRGRDLATPVAMESVLAESEGTVLDPIFALRYRLAIPAGKVARVALWTFVAPSRAELLDLIDKHHDRNAYDRAKTLAWTQAQVQLRHLGIKADEAADFQRLAAPILYSDPRLRPASAVISRGLGAQSGLWAQGISGDLPIVVCLIDDLEDLDQVRQLLHAHEYWRMKRLAVDLVIVNERASSYTQDLQIAIETAVRTSESRPRFGQELAQGTVYALRADLINSAQRALLRSTARIVMTARQGNVADQLARVMSEPNRTTLVPRATRLPLSSARPASPQLELEFFNGLGGFDKDGLEYVTVLKGDQSTPAPWLNVIANPGFGFQVSAEGSGYTWSDNSRENQLTPWSNDAVSDPPGEAFYVRDEESRDIWSPTAQPIRDGGTYIARHGRGYSRFEHTAHDIHLDLLQYVPLADPIKISRLRLRNLSKRVRRLSVTGYAEWVLGTSHGASSPTIVTEVDAATGALLARSPWNLAFGHRVAFADLRGRQTAWTADRGEFLGRNGRLSAPAALTRDASLSGRTGAGLDPCGVLQAAVELQPGEVAEVVFLLGQTGSEEAARSLIARYRDADLDAVFHEVERHWDGLLGTIQVKTPDRAMDIMLNGWLLYQTLACRIWARSAFYQASGAYGFRDQLQDGMALTFAKPEITRHHLLRVAARQFVEGDVQHWWLPHSGQGVRTRISDDRVWLAFGVATYLEATADTAILDELVPFLEGPQLNPGEHDAFFQPGPADESAPLFEHCARGLDQCLGLTGEHGLPLIGSGDWNDGMNRVGDGGKGESVWLGWLLARTIDLFVPYADTRDPGRAGRWRAHRTSLQRSLELAWDGEWYRRGSFDDGTPLGSAQSEECRIDSIAQSWAVLSRAGSPSRAAQAMGSVSRHLIRREERLALLFTPPFDRTPLDPGYIKGYPPGLRENGGQYSHAAMWAVLAFAELGKGDEAGELFALLNPINHSRTAYETARYKVEPYVVAADVYSIPPHVGRGGWTWYTGAAGWMYRAGIEGILGIRLEGGLLRIDPCISAAWPGFSATVRRGSTRYDITVANPMACCSGLSEAELDGVSLDLDGASLSLPLDGGAHLLALTLGNRPAGSDRVASSKPEHPARRF